MASLSLRAVALAVFAQMNVPIPTIAAEMSNACGGNACASTEAGDELSTLQKIVTRRGGSYNASGEASLTQLKADSNWGTSWPYYQYKTYAGACEGYNRVVHNLAGTTAVGYNQNPSLHSCRHKCNTDDNCDGYEIISFSSDPADRSRYESDYCATFSRGMKCKGEQFTTHRCFIKDKQSKCVPGIFHSCSEMPNIENENQALLVLQSQWIARYVLNAQKPCMSPVTVSKTFTESEHFKSYNYKCPPSLPQACNTKAFWHALTLTFKGVFKKFGQAPRYFCVRDSEQCKTLHEKRSAKQLGWLALEQLPLEMAVATIFGKVLEGYRLTPDADRRAQLKEWVRLFTTTGIGAGVALKPEDQAKVAEKVASEFAKELCTDSVKQKLRELPWWQYDEETHKKKGLTRYLGYDSRLFTIENGCSFAAKDYLMALGPDGTRTDSWWQKKFGVSHNTMLKALEGGAVAFDTTKFLSSALALYRYRKELKENSCKEKVRVQEWPLNMLDLQSLYGSGAGKEVLNSESKWS